MPTIDVEQLNEFFDNYKSVPMPQVMMQGIRVEGSVFKRKDLETSVIEWSNLRRFAPKIAQDIENTSLITFRGCNIPMLKEIGTPNYFVYSPRDGKYMGAFKINATSGQKRPTEF